MEQIQGTRKAPNSSTKDDIISIMPDIVMTRILNHLPIQDAIRTSILARNWRFKWTMLTQLDFGEDFVKYLSRLCVEGNDNNWYGERIISRLFIHLKGPVTKFVLWVPADKVLNVEDFYHWVMFLSRNGIMEFTYMNYNGEPIELPTHLYSCLELTHLMLYNCHFSSTPPFGSFSNLLSLDISWVTFASEFCEIIALSPLLEILILGNDPNEDPFPKLKLVEITKLKNLKMLSLPLRALETTAIANYSIFHLGGYFPKLEELYLSFDDCKFVGEAVSRKLVCDSFSCVKTLSFDYVDFSGSITLPFALKIIWGCPNLRTLTIVSDTSTISSLAFRPSELNYITVGQLKLLNVEFLSFSGSKSELFLIKSLLAYTPLLKKITIRPDTCLNVGGYKRKMMLAIKLLRFPRASTIAKVDLQGF